MAYRAVAGVPIGAVLVIMAAVALAWLLFGPVGVLVLAAAWYTLGHW